MILYVFLAIIAAVIQIATVYFMRVGIIKSFLWAIPFVLLHQYLFLYNYTKAPNFIVIWFVTVAVTSSLSFIIGYWFFKDVLSTYQIFGILLILAGVVLLRF